MKFIQWLKSLFTHPAEEKTSMSKIALSLSALAGVLANATAANVLTIQVTDDSGTGIAGQTVTLSGDAGVILSGTTLTTDSNGQATASLTSSAAGSYQVTAVLSDGTSQSITVPFLAVADTGTAEVKTTTATSSPLEQAKAKFDAFVEFVEHGLEVLGEDAEADLVALKDKFL